MVAQKQPLLDEEDAFTPLALQALTEIFQRFDLDNDGVFSQQEIDAFAIASNGKKFDDATLEEIRQYFDIDTSNQLTLKGFLEMFQMQTLGEQEETWRDLAKHGYDEQLRRTVIP